MAGVFITFEGTEGGGKSTQIELLARRLRESGRIVRTLREPGGTPIGEEIRHLLKHSDANHAMTAEAELLLMNASRAQLVREVIRPALAAGEIVLCDRFYDSTVAYQGYGRGLDLQLVHSIITAAVGETRPHLTLLLMVPVEVSEQRRHVRQQESDASRSLKKRDRFEEANRDFFQRVENGYREISRAESLRVRSIDATREVAEVAADVWKSVVSRWPELRG